MKHLQKVLLMFSLLIIISSYTHANVQQQDSASRYNPLYSKWKLTFGYTISMGFNLGKKIIPINKEYGSVPFAGAKISLINPRETSKYSNQFSIGILSKSFFKNRMAIRISMDYDEYYYEGVSTEIFSYYHMCYPLPDWTETHTYIDGYKYSFKDCFINLSILPQVNFIRGNNISGYFFLGPKMSLLMKEIVTDYTLESDWKEDKKNYTLFCNTGIGSSFNLYKRLIFDFQLRFNYQLLTTPGHRRLASAGLMFGLMF
jgi:hypothetical protein